MLHGLRALVPQSGIQPTLLTVEVHSLTNQWTARKSQQSDLILSLVFSDSSVHRWCALIMLFTTQWTLEHTCVSCRSIYKQYYTTRAGEGNGNPLQYSYLENPWTEEPGGLQCMGWQRVVHHWACMPTCTQPVQWLNLWVQNHRYSYSEKVQFSVMQMVSTPILVFKGQLLITCVYQLPLRRLNKSICKQNFH